MFQLFRGAEEYEKAKQFERDGDLKQAVQWYKKAEKLGHDLQDDIDPEEQFAYSTATSANGGPAPADPSNEKEDHLRLTPEEIERLQRFDDALSYRFTEEQKDFLETNGYLVIKGVIPHDICDRMLSQCFEKAHKLWGVHRANYKTWNPLEGGGFIDIWHTPAYYEIRQLPALYSIFAQLLREPKLTVSLDRVCMKPPAFIDIPDMDDDGATFQRITFEQGEFPIHTDMNLWYLGETKYQGGCALEDCPPGGGGFRCVPGFHKLEHIREYRRRFEAGEFHFSSSDSQGNKRRGPSKVFPPDAESVFEYFMDEEWKEKCIEARLALTATATSCIDSEVCFFRCSLGSAPEGRFCCLEQ